MMVPFGEYLPDQPDFQSAGSAAILNVVPKTQGSYGPAPSMSAVTGALRNRCLGAAFTRDFAGNVWGIAGDATRLYKNVAGSTNWINVSRAGSYSTPTDGQWSLAQFGERIVATNWVNEIQSMVMGVDPLFSNLSADAPKARYVARVRDFLMVANTVDGVDGSIPQRVWWPAIGDPTTWPTPGSDTAAQLQSGFVDLYGDGGWNQGIAAGLSGADVVIFQERNIWRGMYIGPPAVFSFSQIESARGTPAPGSIVSIGPAVYYLADDGFYACDGSQSVAIGNEKVDRTFWADVDQSFLYRITAAVDPTNKLIYWAYPGPQNEGGLPNRILVYHYGLGRWSKIDAQTVEIMVSRALTIGYTLDQLDQFGTLETLPFPLDSRAWTGGALNLAGFDRTHKLAYFSGTPLAATIDSTEANLNEKGMAFISRVWPMVDVVAAEVTMGRRNRLADPVVWGSPSSMTATTGNCPVRSTGVFHRARMTIPAGETWTHAQGFQFDARSAGRR